MNEKLKQMADKWQKWQNGSQRFSMLKSDYSQRLNLGGNLKMSLEKQGETMFCPKIILDDLNFKNN